MQAALVDSCQLAELVKNCWQTLPKTSLFPGFWCLIDAEPVLHVVDPSRAEIVVWYLRAAGMMIGQ